MEVWLRVALIIFGSAMGSTGLWAYVRSRDVRRNAQTRLMMGLAYVQITTLGLEYIKRGTITKDEFEDYRKYFYEPYKELGGNGVAERIMHDVSNLPFGPHIGHSEIFRNTPEGWINNVRVVPREELDSTAR